MVLKYISKSNINTIETTTEMLPLRQARALYGAAKGHISENEWYEKYYNLF